MVFGFSVALPTQMNDPVEEVVERTTKYVTFQKLILNDGGPRMYECRMNYETKTLSEDDPLISNMKDWLRQKFGIVGGIVERDQEKKMVLVQWADEGLFQTFFLMNLDVQ